MSECRVRAPHHQSNRFMRTDTAIAIGLALGTLLLPQRLEAASALTRIDRRIQFNWANGSPGKGVPADKFSVRWTGAVRLPRDGNVHFSTRSRMMGFDCGWTTSF